MLIFACTSKQVGLKENWIDERDVIALAGGSVNEWMLKAGRPTLVEINGDTSIYYYNYRPTMYATAIYDSTTFFKTWGTAKEIKPGLENSIEIWGSRKNIMQIKVVNNIAVSAVITEGPDKKSFIRDLNGNIVLDPSSGYNSNISDEQKIGGNSEYFKSAYSKISKDTNAINLSSTAGTNMNPWESYRYKQQLEANQSVAAESVEPIAAESAIPVAADSAAVPIATESASPPQAIEH